MTKYICQRCLKEFVQKSQYNKHLKKKTPCKKKENVELIVEEKVEKILKNKINISKKKLNQNENEIINNKKSNNMTEETKMSEDNIVVVEKDFTKMKRKELIDYCRKNKIAGFSGKKKHYIINLIKKYNSKNESKESKESNESKESKESKEIKNLINTNIEYIKKVFNKELLDILKNKYIYCKNNYEKNIYNFIQSYIFCIKVKNDIRILKDSLYKKILENNKIKILWGNSLDLLKKLPNESIGHMVTSPPYYNAREYSTWDNLNLYLDDMKKIIIECYRVLENHRVFVFNISDVVGNDNINKISVFGKRKIPLPAYFIKIFEECGFMYIDDIIWDKGEVQSSRHKNSNKPYPFFQYSCNCYEHILIFHKHRLEKDIKYPCNQCGSLTVKTNSYTCKGLRSWECKNTVDCKKSKSNRGKRFSLKTIVVQNPYLQKNNIIDKDTIKSWRRDIHKLNPVIKINNKKENKLGHTAPFPMAIPEMSIKYYSYKGDTVLDMFAGSFTTAIAAQKLGRIGIGFELRKDLFKDCIIKNLNNHNCEFEEI